MGNIYIDIVIVMLSGILISIFACKYTKLLMILVILSAPISFEVLHYSKDLLVYLSGGVNGNGVYAILSTVFALPALLYKALRLGWRPSYSIIFYAVCVALLAVSLTYSENKAVGVKYIGYMIYVCVPYMLYKVVKIQGNTSASKVVKYIILAVVISAAFGMFVDITGMVALDVSKSSYISGTSIERYANTVGFGASHWATSMAIIIMFAITIFDGRKEIGIIYYYGLCLCAVILIMTYTRIPFIIVAIFVVVYTVYKRRFGLAGLAVIVIASIVIFTPYGMRMQLLVQTTGEYKIENGEINKREIQIDETEEGEFFKKDGSTPFRTGLSGRAIMLKGSLEVALSAPVIGYGAGESDIILNKHMEKNMNMNVPIVNIHSEFLRIWIEAGIIAATMLILFIALMIIEIWGAMKRNKKCVMGITLMVYYGICIAMEPLFGWYKFAGTLYYLAYSVLSDRGAYDDIQQLGERT